MSFLLRKMMSFPLVFLVQTNFKAWERHCAHFKGTQDEQVPLEQRSFLRLVCCSVFLSYHLQTKKRKKTMRYIWKPATSNSVQEEEEEDDSSTQTYDEFIASRKTL